MAEGETVEACRTFGFRECFGFHIGLAVCKLSALFQPAHVGQVDRVVALMVATDLPCQCLATFAKIAFGGCRRVHGDWLVKIAIDLKKDLSI